jgi:Fe-S-cluster containining protein
LPKGRITSVICILKMEHSCLRLHAGYRCRHAGACCTAGWAIPVEGPVHERLQVHFGQTQADRRLFASGDPPPDGTAAVLATESDGRCVFFEPAKGNLCAIHRELGPAWLPGVCRQFPRVVLRDGRGTRISLSHFCPTAATLLSSHQPADFDVIEAPDTLTLGGNAEGLDARHVLPPLLEPGMLTDLDGYDAWEHRAIALLGRADLTAPRALAQIGTATYAVQAWRPGASSLRETVEREFDIASSTKPDEDLDADGVSTDAVQARVDLALRSIPDGLPHPGVRATFEADWRQIAPWWHQVDAVLRAYLAARLFGNWIAYYGQGLHVVVEYLQVALAVVKMEAAKDAAHTPSSPCQTVTAAIRNADLLLVHLSDPKTLARLLAPSRRG